MKTLKQFNTQIIIYALGFFISQTVFAEKANEENAQPEKSKKYLLLSDEEKGILEEGRIEDSRRVLGGLVGSTIGLGLGHAIVGKYSDIGWAFTIAEPTFAFITLMGLGNAIGAGLCENCSDKSRNDSNTRASILIPLGLVGFGVFKIWEIFDIWSRPVAHNERYDEIQRKVSAQAPKVDFMILPSMTGSSEVVPSIQVKF